MMDAARTSETSVDNHFTRQYNPEDDSEHWTGQLYEILCRLKAVPQNTHGNVGDERLYSSYSFTISALDGGECSASRTGRA
jgi:hypothetical protein